MTKYTTIGKHAYTIDTTKTIKCGKPDCQLNHYRLGHHWTKTQGPYIPLNNLYANSDTNLPIYDTLDEARNKLQ